MKKLIPKHYNGFKLLGPFSALSSMIDGTNANRKLRKVVSKPAMSFATAIADETNNEKAIGGSFFDNLKFRYNNPLEHHGFLMSYPDLERFMLSLGYHKVSNSNGYGLVNKAVKSVVGDKNIPIYQIGDDDVDISRLKIVKPLFYDSEDYRTINRSLNIRGRMFRDAGSFPSTIYLDTINGKKYIKSYDFENFGNKDKGLGHSYKGLLLKAANLLDEVGNPFVLTTGLTEIEEIPFPKYNTDLQEKMGSFLANFYPHYDLNIPLKLTEKLILDAFNAEKTNGDDILDYMELLGWIQYPTLNK